MELSASAVADEARKSLRLLSKRLGSDLSGPSEDAPSLERMVGMTLQGPPVTFQIQRTARRGRAFVLITFQQVGGQFAWLLWLVWIIYVGVLAWAAMTDWFNAMR